MTKPKAGSQDFLGRVRELGADPLNKHIPACAGAGRECEPGWIRMHNGLKVRVMPGFWKYALTHNKSVHEPQEEYAFGQVLSLIPEGGTMIELGAYWAFYSMWFNTSVPNARNLMVEPLPDNLRYGKDNFAANGLKGEFFCDWVGRGDFTLENFMDKNNVKSADIVHADIQRAELTLLRGSGPLLEAKRVKCFFISTHSQEIHHACTAILKDSGYDIIASADFDYETFCHDGVLVAALSDLRWPVIELTQCVEPPKGG